MQKEEHPETAVSTNLVVRSEEDAWQALEKLHASSKDDENFSLQVVSWEKMVFTFKGEHFNGSVTAETAQLVVDLQNSIYRAYALIKYQVANVQLLNAEEKENLKVTVQVSQGSTKLIIDAIKIILPLASKTLGKMSGKQTTALLLVLILTFFGAYSLHEFLQYRADIRKHETQNEVVREVLKSTQFLSAEETKRLAMLREAMSINPSYAAVMDEADKYKKSLLNSAAEAEDGAVLLDIPLEKQVAEELRKNSRETAEPIRLDGIYRITKVSSPQNLTEFIIQMDGLENGMKFSAILDSRHVTPETIELIKEATFTKEPVNVVVNARRLRGSIQNAVIISASSETADVEPSVPLVEPSSGN